MKLKPKPIDSVIIRIQPYSKGKMKGKSKSLTVYETTVDEVHQLIRKTIVEKAENK